MMVVDDGGGWEQKKVEGDCGKWRAKGMDGEKEGGRKMVERRRWETRGEETPQSETWLMIQKYELGQKKSNLPTLPRLLEGRKGREKLT